MKRMIVLAAAICAAAFTAKAGGYVTNTNQNVAFLRNPAQNAVIGVQGAYFNPAGIGFMDNGWHLAFDVQTALQRRYTTSTYEPLKYGVDNEGRGYKKYTGKSFVPALPHLSLAFKHDNLFASFHFGVVSGGGKAKYDQGLGSFEAPVAMIPALINNLAGSQMVTGYDVDVNLTGEQYNFAGQLNIGYKINPQWSVSAGVRLNYISNYYLGSLRNIQLQFGGQMLPAANVLGAAVSAISGGLIPTETAVGMVGGLVSDKELDAHQKDIAWTPVLSVDYKTGKVEDKDVNITDENAEGIVEALFGPSNEGRPKIALQLFLYDVFCRESEDYKGQRMVNVIYPPANMFTEPVKEVPVSETFMRLTEGRLHDLLSEIASVDVPFRRTDEEKTCSFCDFRMICGR